MSSEEWELLHDAADRTGDRLIRNLLDLVRQTADLKILQEVETLLRRGFPQRAVEIAAKDWDAAAAQFQTTFGNEVLTLFQKAGAIAADFLPELKMSFDLTNPEAVLFARTRASRFALTLNSETRAALASTVTRSFIEGIPPHEAARQLRDAIGLASKEASALANYRKFLAKLAGQESLDDLSSSVKEKLKRSDIRVFSKKGLTEERIDRMAEAYRSRLLRERAETLVRTETIAASNNGQQALWKQAIDAGLLEEARTMRKWIVTPDDRLCPICRPMKGQERRFNEEFVSPFNGARTRVPPIHWKCRCALGLVFKRKVN